MIGRSFYIFLHSVSEMSRKDGFEISGYIAYSTMFSLFPFLVFLTALGGILGDEQTTKSFIDFIVIYLPKDVSGTLVPVVQQVIASPRGGLLTIGLATSIWSAASGVDALRMALNRAYQASETRSYVRRKVQSFLFVIGGVVVVFAISILIILGPYLLEIAQYFLSIFGDRKLLLVVDQNATAYHLARYLVGLLLLTATLVLLHRWLPNRRIAWSDILPGTIFTTVFWIMCATGFSYYIGKFSHYGATYGSLGGVIITLLFFYLTAAVFILGGEVNATVWHEAHPDKPNVPPPDITGETAKSA